MLEGSSEGHWEGHPDGNCEGMFKCPIWDGSGVSGICLDISGASLRGDPVGNEIAGLLTGDTIWVMRSLVSEQNLAKKSA